MAKLKTPYRLTWYKSTLYVCEKIVTSEIETDDLLIEFIRRKAGRIVDSYQIFYNHFLDQVYFRIFYQKQPLFFGKERNGLRMSPKVLVSSLLALERECSIKKILADKTKALFYI